MTVPLALQRDGIPLISMPDAERIDPDDAERLSAQILQAAECWGCFHLTGAHFVSDLQRLFMDASARFYEQSYEEKSELRVAGSYRGYSSKNIVPMRTSNRYEIFNVIEDGDRERKGAYALFSGPNVWPEWICGWRSSVEAGFIRARRLAECILMALLANFTTETRRVIMGGFAKGPLFVKFLRYPAIDRPATGFGVHTDYGGVTLVFHDDPAGLVIYPRHGRPLSVARAPHGVFVLFGDMLKHWTAGRLHSPPHCVNLTSGHERLAVVCCYEPDFDFLVSPLAEFTCDGASTEPQSIRYGHYLLFQTFMRPLASP